jgi:hypothetical protein
MEEQLIREDFSSISNNIFRFSQKHAEPTTGHFFCSCSVCELQRKGLKSEDTAIQSKEDFANHEGREKSFTWLLKEVGKASKDNIIKINIPETIVFRKSKPSFLLQQKADRALKLTTSVQKLKIAELRKMFSAIARQRKREEFPAYRPARPETYGKEVALVRYMYRDFDNELPFIPASYEHGALRVMQDSEFSDLMLERAGSSVWRRISYIQSVVKCKAGINETFVWTYYSHDANDQKAILELQQAGKDDNEVLENSLMSNLPAYAAFVSKRIAYLLAVYSQQELLRFSPEFIIDDNGKVWLTYATRISVKQIEVSTADQDILFKRVELRNVESKERLNEELQTGFHEAKAPHQLRMLTEMSKHYGDLKERIGINELMREKPRDPVSNDAFAKLRPFSPYSFYELIDPESRKRILQRQTTRKKKVTRVEPFVRPFTREKGEQINENPWKIGKLAGESARSGVKTSSRFSEHLKEWIRPSKSVSVIAYHC